MMSKPDTTDVSVITTDPVPARAEVIELASENRPPVVAEPVEELPAPPLSTVMPTEPDDYLHVHRRLQHLISVLEQTGAIPSHEVHRCRTSP
jgi:hypothetical protein